MGSSYFPIWPANALLEAILSNAVTHAVLDASANSRMAALPNPLYPIPRQVHHCTRNPMSCMLMLLSVLCYTAVMYKPGLSDAQNV